MEYNKEELKLYNERKHFSKFNNIYDIEHRMTRQEKIDFIDKYYVDGRTRAGTEVGSYMYNLIKDYNEQKDSLPHDHWGYVKTVSLKAWLRKHDTRGLVDIRYHYGSYDFAGREYTSMELTANPTWSSHVPYDSDSDVVNLWFHDVLSELANKEEKYYRTTNNDNIKVRKIVEYGKMYGSFGLEKVGMVVGNGENVLDDDWLRNWHHEKITTEELDKMIKVYEDFDKVYKDFSEKAFVETGFEKYKD